MTNPQTPPTVTQDLIRGPASSPYQPRFAAFMASFGRTDTPARLTTELRLAFVCDFIPRCRRTAPEGVFIGDHCADHDAFTAFCWAIARDDVLQRFPA